MSIDPNGDVFPCCLKTAAPLGNLREERLEDILDSLVGHPAFEAIAMGRRERMGVAFGWDVARFLREGRTERGEGDALRNLFLGCDRFHRAVLGEEIARIRAARRAARGGATAT